MSNKEDSEIRLHYADGIEVVKTRPLTKEEQERERKFKEAQKHLPDSYFHNPHNMEIKHRFEEAMRKDREQMRKEGKIK